MTPGQKFVEKKWGSETWIVNFDKYCGKILDLKKDYFCSWHYHKLKTETFHVLEGDVLLYYGTDEDIQASNIVRLTKGMSFHIPPMLIHRFLGLQDSKILEISTQHFDEDSYRISESGKII